MIYMLNVKSLLKLTLFMNNISKNNINISYLERQFCDLWQYYYPDLDLEAEYRFCNKRKLN